MLFFCSWAATRRPSCRARFQSAISYARSFLGSSVWLVVGLAVCGGQLDDDDFFWIPLFFGAKNRFRQPKGKIHEHQKTTVVSVGKQQFILESWHGPLVRPATQDKTVNCWVYTLQVEIATPFGHIQCGCTAVEWSLSVKQKANKHPK